MTREQRVIETFVQLADALVGDFDPDELLYTLAQRCLELLDVDGAGVMLAMEPGELHVAAATGIQMQQLEIFEIAVAEGPCYAAYTSGEVVRVPDLTTTEERWPRFTPRALQLGFAAAHGLPLRVRDRVVGSFNLFQGRGRSALTDADLLVARGFADVATLSLIQAELVHDTETTVGQLTHALSARVITEQAKGVLAERLGVSPQQAFERLRKHARDHNRRVHDVARDVVEGGLDIV